MYITLPKRQNVPSCKLYVQTIPEDISNVDKQNTAVLIPGGPGGNHTVYDDIKNEISSAVDLVLFDPRGCGYSTKSDSKYSNSRENEKSPKAMGIE